MSTKVHGIKIVYKHDFDLRRQTCDNTAAQSVLCHLIFYLFVFGFVLFCCSFGRRTHILRFVCVYFSLCAAHLKCNSGINPFYHTKLFRFACTFVAFFGSFVKSSVSPV